MIAGSVVSVICAPFSSGLLVDRSAKRTGGLCWPGVMCRGYPCGREIKSRPLRVTPPPHTAGMWFTSEEQSCRGTLILHADGTDECEHGHLCGADELLHEH